MTIVDAGVLVAFLDKRDTFHSWCVKELNAIQPPVATCESVLTEAYHLLKSRVGANGVNALLTMIQRTSFDIECMNPHIKRIVELMQAYSDVPMDFTDACLVVLSEQEHHKNSVIVTLDADFYVYRRNDNEAIPVSCPR